METGDLHQIELLPCGTTGKTQGIRGDLFFFPVAALQDQFSKMNWMFFEIKGNKVPFRISKFEDSEPPVIQLEGVDTPESAKALSNRQVWVDVYHLPEKALGMMKKTSELSELQNFIILSEDHQSIAKIIRTLEYPSQLMAEVEIDGMVFLIPLHEDFIQDINISQKKIVMNLPFGLIPAGNATSVEESE